MKDLKDIVVEEAKRQIRKLGVKKFTVEDIALQLSISKKTIYKHFAGKSEIVSAVVDHVIENEKAYAERVMASREGPLVRMEALMLFYSGEGVPGWVIEELKIFYPEEYQKSQKLNILKRQYFEQLFTEGVSNGEIRSDVKPLVLNLMIKKIIDAFLETDFLTKQDITINQAIQQVRDIILYGIAHR